MIESGLVSLLRVTPAITALIGTDHSKDVYAVLVPPTATYPCLSYHSTSKPPEVSLDNSGQESTRIQIDCWAKSYAEVKALQVALHALLDGFKGRLPDGTLVDLSTRDVEGDYYESDNEIFRCLSEYIFTHPSGQ